MDCIGGGGGLVTLCGPRQETQCSQVIWGAGEHLVIEIIQRKQSNFLNKWHSSIFTVKLLNHWIHIMVTIGTRISIFGTVKKVKKMNFQCLYILNPCEVIDNPWLQPSHQCWQDYISLIANSIFLYLATISQLYLFLCYKMNVTNYKLKRHLVLKVTQLIDDWGNLYIPWLQDFISLTYFAQDIVWSGSLLLVIIQIFKVGMVIGKNEAPGDCCHVVRCGRCSWWGGSWARLSSTRWPP